MSSLDFLYTTKTVLWNTLLGVVFFFLLCLALGMLREIYQKFGPRFLPSLTVDGNRATSVEKNINTAPKGGQDGSKSPHKLRDKIWKLLHDQRIASLVEGRSSLEPAAASFGLSTLPASSSISSTASSQLGGLSKSTIYSPALESSQSAVDDGSIEQGGVTGTANALKPSAGPSGTNVPKFIKSRTKLLSNTGLRQTKGNRITLKENEGGLDSLGSQGKNGPVAVFDVKKAGNPGLVRHSSFTQEKRISAGLKSKPRKSNAVKRGKKGVKLEEQWSKFVQKQSFGGYSTEEEDLFPSECSDTESQPHTEDILSHSENSTKTIRGREKHVSQSSSALTRLCWTILVGAIVVYVLVVFWLSSLCLQPMSQCAVGNFSSTTIASETAALTSALTQCVEWVRGETAPFSSPTIENPPEKTPHLEFCQHSFGIPLLLQGAKAFKVLECLILSFTSRYIPSVINFSDLSAWVAGEIVYKWASVSFTKCTHIFDCAKHVFVNFTKSVAWDESAPNMDGDYKDRWALVSPGWHNTVHEAISIEVQDGRIVFYTVVFAVATTILWNCVAGISNEDKASELQIHETGAEKEHSPKEEPTTQRSFEKQTLDHSLTLLSPKSRDTAANESLTSSSTDMDDECVPGLSNFTNLDEPFEIDEQHGRDEFDSNLKWENLSEDLSFDLYTASSQLRTEMQSPTLLSKRFSTGDVPSSSNMLHNLQTSHSTGGMHIDFYLPSSTKSAPVNNRVKSSFLFPETSAHQEHLRIKRREAEQLRLDQLNERTSLILESIAEALDVDVDASCLASAKESIRSIKLTMSRKRAQIFR